MTWKYRAAPWSGPHESDAGGIRGLIRKLGRGPAKARRRCALPRVEGLETRVVLSMSATEAYGWYILNVMRANPAQFANELEGLYKGTISQAHGVSSSDPVWVDLRKQIDGAPYKEHFWQALALLRAQQPLGPLAWSDRLEQISTEHNDWMTTHTYAHSYYPGNPPPQSSGTLPGFKQPGINGDYDVISPDVLKYPGASGNWSTGDWAENIGYKSGGSLPETRKKFGTGTTAHRQRQAYADIVGFIIEVNSTSLGHLKNLLSRDDVSSGFGLAQAKNKSIGVKNAIGIDYNFYDSGLSNGNTNFLATHTLSTAKQYNGEGGYIAGVAYEDKNSNGRYDMGEGVDISWEISDGLLTVGYDTSADNFGVLSDFQTHNGRYTVEVFSKGKSLGKRVVYINDNNVWVEFKVSKNFGLGLVDSGGGQLTPQMAADLYEGTLGNNSSSKATDLGVAAVGSGLGLPTTALSVHSSSDEDWYRFRVADDVARADIRIGFDNSAGNLDAALYRQEANGTLTLISSSTSNGDEEAFVRNLTPGTYLLKVFGRGGKTNFYALSADVVVDAPLYVDFGASGLWRYSDGGGYRQIHFASPESMSVGPDGYLYLDFGPSGLWRYSDGGGYQQLHVGNPESIEAASDGYLYVDFGPSGLWRWSQSQGYQQLHAGNPESISAGFDGYLYVDFGPSGLWRYSDGGGYERLHFGNPESIDAGPDGYLYVDFGNSGLWRWSSDDGYEQLHAGNAESISAGADGYLYVDFGPSGLWRWSQGYGYQQLHAGNPEAVNVSSDGYLYVDFGPSGLWRWSIADGYERLHFGDPKQIKKW